MSKLSIGDIVAVKSLDKTQAELGVSSDMVDILESQSHLQVIGIKTENGRLIRVEAAVLTPVWHYHPDDLEKQ